MLWTRQSTREECVTSHMCNESSTYWRTTRGLEIIHLTVHVMDKICNIWTTFRLHGPESVMDFVKPSTLRWVMNWSNQGLNISSRDKHHLYDYLQMQSSFVFHVVRRMESPHYWQLQRRQNMQSWRLAYTPILVNVCYMVPGMETRKLELRFNRNNHLGKKQ